MIDMRFTLRDWVAVIGGALLGTVFCVVIAVVADLEHIQTLNDQQRFESLRNDIAIPIALAFPFFSLLIWKIRQLRLVKQALEVLVQTDSLIGCLNRRAFTSKVNDRLEQLGQSGSETIAMMLIDIDHFKRVNDTVGHEQGDEALKLVGQAIQEQTGENLLFGRIGGEEFGVFVTRVNPAIAHLTAEKIRLIVASVEFNPRGDAWPLSVSIGVSVSKGKIDFQELYREADIGLYEAKTGGRDRVVVRHLDAIREEKAA